MKYPTEEEIINEVEELKSEMDKHYFKMGIVEGKDRRIFNRVNRILRMLKQPVRRVDIKFLQIKKGTLNIPTR